MTVTLALDYRQAFSVHLALIRSIRLDREDLRAVLARDGVTREDGYVRYLVAELSDLRRALRSLNS